MGTALTMLLLLTFSILITRVASVVLRLTGVPDTVARFQALSAFSGTGFTTSEAETIVNYPIRRRVVSLLMVIGNIGLVAVLATLVVGFVRTGGEMQAAVHQVYWLLGAVGVVWLFLLNPVSDRILCDLLDRLLRSTTELGTRPYHRILTVTDGWSVCEHPVTGNMSLSTGSLREAGLTLLAVHRAGGMTEAAPGTALSLAAGDALVLYGPDGVHEEWTPGSLASASPG